MMQALQRALRPLVQRLQLMVGRAVLSVIDDSRQLQSLQVSLLADEVRADVERFQNYGFTSVPFPGAEAVAVSVAGNRDHVIVVAVDDRRYRLKGLQAGEVAVYTDEGDSIVIKRGGVIEVTASTKVRLLTPLVECSNDLLVHGNAHIEGTLQVDGGIHSDASIVADADVADQGGAKTMAGMRTQYNGHKHGTGPTPLPTM